MYRKILFLLLFFPPLLSYSQKTNRFKNKNQHGKWITYHDSAKTSVDAIGRYKKGYQKGVWKYYSEQGFLDKKEIHRFGKIKISYYFPSGKIKKQGKAKIVVEEKIIHFFFYGDWYVYDSIGTLLKKQFYKEGTRISEINYSTSPTINDSLVEVLKNMNQDVYKYHDSVKLAESTFGKNSTQFQRAKSLNALHTSKLLEELNQIIVQFGYPGKTLVGAEYAIAFSIISSANIVYKEKHYNTIIDEANKGELEWKDVAYFVDKVKVAKKEKQVYGTQYKMNESLKKIVHYPIEDIDKLNERRKQVGLNEMDITELIFVE